MIVGFRSVGSNKGQGNLNPSKPFKTSVYRACIKTIKEKS